MKKFIQKQTLYILLSLLAPFSAIAQMPHDAIYMPKKTICTAFLYGNSSFSNYWEGTLLRDNPNMGTNTMQSFSIMSAYGISGKLNVIAMIPYVTTQNSAGNLKGQKGLQDFSLWLKYKALEKNGFSLHGVLGASTPMSNYIPDFLPMSIGLKSRTASGKVIFNYNHSTGLYLTAHGTYTLRSNIKIDRDAYQAYEKVINSNQVGIPNAADAAVRVGILKKSFQAEVFVNRFNCVKGDNIRRNDMPFPTNNMRATSIGFYGKYQYKNTGITGQISQVINGLNVGKSLNYSLGLLWQMNFNKTTNL
jgi:Putative MetA-pathway of phenol degradation